MEKIYYNKLIRDNLPAIIAARGAECHVTELDETTFIRELHKKVGEEASGLLNVASRAELLGELADIQIVLEEIKKVHGISAAEMEQAQTANWQKKGGFHKRLFLEWSSDTGYKTNEKQAKK